MPDQTLVSFRRRAHGPQPVPLAEQIETGMGLPAWSRTLLMPRTAMATCTFAEPVKPVGGGQDSAGSQANPALADTVM